MITTTTKWTDASLEEAVEIIRGITFPSNVKAKVPSVGSVACLRTTNVQREVEWDDLWYVPKSFVKRDIQFVREFDILISNANSRELVGKVALIRNIPMPATLGTFITLFRTKNGNDPRFIFFQLSSAKVQSAIRETASTTTNISNVSTKKLAQIELRLPPITDQRSIVAEIEKQFTRLDAGVAALKRVQANLKRYRAAVLKAACEGKLVPTEAELAKKENRKYETGSELLQQILAERRQKWNGRGKYKEPFSPDITELSSLPDGWAWATVAQLSILVQYGSSAKTNENSAGVPVLRMGNIQDGKFDFKSLKYLPKKHDEFPALFLSIGDLVFNRTNSADLVGKTAVFKGVPNPCSFASYLIRVRLAEGCLPDYVCYFINSFFGRSWIASVVNQQVGQANVNGTKLQALAVPLPPIAEQMRIVAEVERRLSVIEELEAAVTANLLRATRLRQAILKRAFDGHLF